ncbi:MAG: RNA polymerase factor sigma-54 [Planctomycetes bacterium]|nr:RNA polymerase factor sigma-54 [Planctomycetota bacterium]
MRLGLTQHLRAEQRLVQSPQMIQAMQVLQCPMAELIDRIDQELQENVFLEVKEESAENEGGEKGESAAETPREDDRQEANDATAELWNELESLERRAEGVAPRTPTISDEEADRRLDALYNTPAQGISLPDHLLSQVRMTEIDPVLFRVVEHIVYSLDEDGRLAESAEQIADTLLVPIPLAERAIELVRALDPPGVGARDLRDCLLMQLDRMNYVQPLTRLIVEKHLDDLAMNRLPKIARDTNAELEDVKDSWTFLRDYLNPHPGAAFSETRGAIVVPDVIVEEIDGRFEVRSERGRIPELGISVTYKNLLKEARDDPKVHEYLRRKIDAAKWFIEAVHQRQSTIERIASEVVSRQQDFLRNGIRDLRPMKMQEVADAVGVHISTVSRAISGKYIQTPQGVMDLKRFFSGGTVTDSGEHVSQRAVKDKLRQLVEAEDKHNPWSDDQLVEELGRQGVHIARRTVTKYRKALGIESSTRRRAF